MSNVTRSSQRGGSHNLNLDIEDVVVVVDDAVVVCERGLYTNTDKKKRFIANEMATICPRSMYIHTWGMVYRRPVTPLSELQVVIQEI